MMDATAIVPYRGDASGERARNAEAVLAWLAEAGIPTVLAEHSAVADHSLSIPAGVRRVFTEADGAFSKAAACNAGVIRANTPVVVLVDADTVVRATVLRACIRRARDRDEVIRPFGRLIEWDLEQTRRFHETGTLPGDGPGQRDETRDGELISPAGGILVLPTERFFAAGGMDESFRGWGGEDDAFSSALARTGSPVRVLKAEPAFHLRHERSLTQRYAHVHYPENARRALWWAQASEAEIQAHVERARAALYGRQEGAA